MIMSLCKLLQIRYYLPCPKPPLIYAVWQIVIELRCGYFGVTVWCQDSCTNFIQRYMLHRDTPERTKVKKRSVQFTNNAWIVRNH